jgi:pre-mRNA-processing factor SLU7
MATGRLNFQTKDEYRKAKELDEARKAGTAPAELDEDGREINPHIPQYIAQAPWYIDQGRPSLKHQRAPQEKYGTINDWYQRGAKKPAADRYRKGACENCGATTHTKATCVERPRKVGAKFTSSNIMPDEVITSVELDYEGKHDRWNGYDTSKHFALMDTYSKVEQLREREKEKALLEVSTTKAKAEADSDSDAEDEFKDSHEVQSGQKFDAKTRTTIRNLRIREDTAKYLWNLDVDSAYYDPKSRSMRANPLPGKDPKDLVFAGDNFIRMNGDAVKLKELERFAWDPNVVEKGVHMQGVPSQAEFYHRQFKEKKEVLKSTLEDEILQRYGGDKNTQQLPPELIFAQTEEYFEYAPDGRLIKGVEVLPTKSKYEEDVFINNHKSVWGSYWENGQWGYACCHSLTKNAYCTGEAGKSTSRLAKQYASREVLDKEISDSSKDEESEDESEDEKSKKKDKKSKDDKDKKRKGEEKEDERERKKKRKSENRSPSDDKDERKRPYNSMHEIKGPTEDEMDSYQLTKVRWEDPMLQFKDDELLPKG